MAKPRKFSDRDKAWVRRPKKVRPHQTRPFRKRILIVCEGEKTEPNYFEAIRKTLPQHSAEVIDIHGAGMNTLNVVEEARKRRDSQLKSNASYDETWVVFDRDSFPSAHFDNAIHSAESHNIQTAWSNEAFEIWYVLHFEDRQTGMSRTEYSDNITRHIDRAYRKNDTSMYRALQKQGDEKSAIRRAKALHASSKGTPPHRANPCTTVYQLVESLNQLRPSKTANEKDRNQ